MALTIATGFVVDDAIVVVENITRHLERGCRPSKQPSRRQRDRVHRRLHQPVARRGVHSDPADGRDRRPPVPRVRGDADGGDHGVDGGLADDYADDVRAASPARQLGTHGRLYALSERGFACDTRALRARARAGAAPPARHAGPHCSRRWRPTFTSNAHSEGILPAAGHGEPGRLHQADQDIVSGHATARRASSSTSSCATRRSTRSRLHAEAAAPRTPARMFITLKPLAERRCTPTR